jgi:tRNA pseudouridine38-40 synthase
LQCNWNPQLPFRRYALEVHGKSFLYKMVRNIVGAVVAAGLGVVTPQQLVECLQSKSRGPWTTAPAHGLTLKRVFYTDW